VDSFNPTTKTQAALTAALQAASAAGNPEIRPAHLLLALLTQAAAHGRPAADQQRRDLAATALP
jgi:ATP-dependent Clp protease ATP-binding subunit ClpB